MESMQELFTDETALVYIHLQLLNLSPSRALPLQTCVPDDCLEFAKRYVCDIAINDERDAVADLGEGLGGL